MRDCHTVFHRSCTIRHSPRRRTRVPVSLHPWQHVCFSILFHCLITILMSVTYHLIVVLLCTSLIANDVEQSCIFLTDRLYIFLVKRLCTSFPRFLIRFFILLLLNYESSLYNLDINPYQIHNLQIFSAVLWVAFSFCW